MDEVKIIVLAYLIVWGILRTVILWKWSQRQRGVRCTEK